MVTLRGGGDAPLVARCSRVAAEDDDSACCFTSAGRFEYVSVGVYIGGGGLVSEVPCLGHHGAAIFFSLIDTSDSSTSLVVLHGANAGMVVKLPGIWI